MQPKVKIIYVSLKEKLIDLYSEGNSKEADKCIDEVLEDVKKGLKSLNGVLEVIQSIFDDFSKPFNISPKLVKLGDYFFDKEEYDSAFRCFDRVQKIQPNNMEAIGKAIKSLRLGRHFDDADEKVKEISFRAKESIKLLAVIKKVGDDYASANEYDKAYECFNEILKIQPSDIEAIDRVIEHLRYGRRFDDAGKKIKEISKQPGLPIEIKIVIQRQLGWLHFDQKQYKEAFKAFDFDNNIFNLIPRSTLLNLSQRRRGNYINAIEGKMASLRLQRLFKEAEKLFDNLDPNISKDPAIQNELGRLYFEQRQYNKAIDVFEQVLKSSEGWHKEGAYEGLIASYRLQHEFDKAMEKADEALKNPLGNPAGIINQQGWIILDVTQKFLHESQNKFDEAKNLAEAQNKVNEARKLICGVGKFLKDEAKRNEFNEAAGKAFDDLDNLIKSFKPDKKLDKTIFYEKRREFNRNAAELAFKEALDKFDAVAKLAKRWPQPRFNKIHVLNRLNYDGKHDDEIERIIKELEGSIPPNLEVKEQIGWVYLFQNKIQKAQKIFWEIWKKDKENIWGINGLGAVYLARGEYKEAEKNFKKILDLDDEPESPIFLNNLALTLVRQDEFNLNDAEDLCNKALEQDISYPPVFLCLAVIAFRRGNYSESENYLKQSIETGMRGSHTDLGALYAKMGRYDEAEKELERAIRVNPNDIQAYLELNHLRFQKAKNNKIHKGETQELFKKAKNIDPNNGDPARAYALALIQSGKSKDVDEAEKFLRETLQHLDEPKRWQLHLTLSTMLLNQGEKIQKSILRRLCYFLASKSKLPKKRKTFRSYYDDALEEANTAKKLKPTHPDPYFLSGVIQCKLGEYENAIEDFEVCRKNTLDKNELYMKAKRHINYIKPFVTSRGHTKWSITKAIITALIIFLIGLIIFLCFHDKIDQNTEITIKEFISVTLALGLIIPSLPFLKRFTLPGVFEAEMKPPEIKPPEISLGPTGEVGFGSLLPTITSGGPLAIGGKMNWPAIT